MKDMKRATNLFLLLGACLMLMSCKREKSDVVRYVENKDNGLLKEVDLGDNIFLVQYTPVSYMLKKEGLKKGSENFEKREKALTGSIWFNIQLKIRNYAESPLRYHVDGLEAYQNRLNYYLNQAPHDIGLIYGKDSIAASSYWFENNQNLLPYETMIVGFTLPGNEKKVTKDIQLVFFDRVFGNGIIKVFFSKNNINKVD